MSEPKGAIKLNSHDIVINNRERLSLNGVKEIINFDENNVNLKTVCGDLLIEGEGIHINVLNIEKGEVEMHGKISALNYFDSVDGGKSSLLSRIFK